MKVLLAGQILIIMLFSGCGNKINPEAVALLDKGNVFLNMMQTDSARYYFDSAIKIDSGYAVAWDKLSEVYFIDTNIERALNAVEKSLLLDDKSASAWNNKGAYLLQRGIFKEGLECLNKSIKLDPSHPDPRLNKATCLRYQNKYSEALEVYDEILAQFPNDTITIINVWRLKSIVQKFQHKIPEAIESQKMVIKYEHNNYINYINMGKLLTINKRYTDAIKYYDTALLYNPKDIDAYIEIGSIYKLIGKNDSALVSYQKMVNADKKHILALYYLTESYYANAQLDSAYKYMNYLIGTPINTSVITKSDVWELCGNIYEKMGRRTYTEALSYYKKALAFNMNKNNKGLQENIDRINNAMKKNKKEAFYE